MTYTISAVPVPNTVHALCQKLWLRLAVSGAALAQLCDIHLLSTRLICGYVTVDTNFISYWIDTHSLLDASGEWFTSFQRNMPGYMPLSWDHLLHVIETTTHIPTMVPMIYQRPWPRIESQPHLVLFPISFHWCGLRTSPPPPPPVNWEWLSPKHEFRKSDRPSIRFPPSFWMRILAHYIRSCPSGQKFWLKKIHEGWESWDAILVFVLSC